MRWNKAENKRKACIRQVIFMLLHSLLNAFLICCFCSAALFMLLKVWWLKGSQRSALFGKGIGAKSQGPGPATHPSTNKHLLRQKRVYFAKVQTHLQFPEKFFCPGDSEGASTIQSHKKVKTKSLSSMLSCQTDSNRNVIVASI